MPDLNILEEFAELREAQPKRQVATWLAEQLPKRLAMAIAEWQQLGDITFAEFSNAKLQSLHQGVNAWQIKPAGTEGWRTAEVTIGGVATDDISQQTFEVKSLPQLAFIGEVLDVTGELGGHNVQWAWASAVACGLSC